MRKFYVLLLLLLCVFSKTFSQCGVVINQALIHAYNAGSGIEGTNEFIVFTTTAAGTAGSYNLYYGSSATPATGSTANLSGLDATAKTGVGGFTGCTITEVTSGNTTIPANSTVIFVPTDVNQTYNISPLCTAGSNGIYVVYINRNGSHSTWATGGQLANSGGARYLEINNCPGDIVSYNAGSSYSTAGDGVSWACGTATVYKNTGTNTSTWTFPSLAPPALLNLTSPLATATQSFCSSLAITNITYNVGGAATGATVTGLPSGVVGNYNAGVFTISGTPTVTGTFNYTVTTTGPSCTNPSLTGSIIISPAAVHQTSSLTGCNSVVYKGITYTSATVLNDTLKSIGGCDSVYKLINVSIAPAAVSETINYNDCNSVVYKGVTYTASTVLSNTLKNISGCDSVHQTINITIGAAPVSETVNFNDCNNVVYKGVTYTSSIVLTNILKNISGCDSVTQTINITIAPAAVSETINLGGCNNVVYKGVTYTSSTVLSNTLKSISGCDSVFQAINITIEPAPVNQTINYNDCNSVVYKGTTYTSSTVLNNTLKNINNCDSVYQTINIMIAAAPVTETVNYSDCNSVVYKGVTYTASTVLSNALKNMNGCDSVYQTINITIAPAPVTETINFNNCNSIVYKGITYTSSAVLNNTLKSIKGCDSVYQTINIIIASAPVNETVNFRDCNNVLYKGVTYTSSTVLNNTLKNINGCDSVYQVINITISSNPALETIHLSGCNNVVYKGSSYTSSTTVNNLLKSISGCDSVNQTVDIVITPILPVTQSMSFSGCKSYLYNGVTYTSSTSVNNTIKSIGGCDSVYQTVNITITQDFDLALNASSNPVDKGTPVTITTTGQVNNSATVYTVTAWEPKLLFSSQNAHSQSFTADTTIHINITAISDGGCISTASLLLVVNPLVNADDFYVPDAFSPNNDGSNDFFKVFGSAVKEAQLTVFNQWGQLLYQGSAISPGWNGAYKNIQQPVGVYVYVVSAVMNDGKVINTKGSFNLIR